MKLHHIGIACKNIKNEKKNFKKLHTVIEESDIIFDKEQNAKVCLLKTEQEVKFEFISGAPVDRLIKKGINLYHLCFEVDNLEKEIRKLVKNGAILAAPPKPAILFNNRKVSFLYVSYGLIELLEKE